MPAHAKFRSRSAEGLLAEARRLGLELPYKEDPSILVEEAALAGRKIPNRLAVLPMEGADADPAGGPSDRTLRRYRRYAAGGAGLIWVEATAVAPIPASSCSRKRTSARSPSSLMRPGPRPRRNGARPTGPSSFSS